jgi:hypothetical protein
VEPHVQLVHGVVRGRDGNEKRVRAGEAHDVHPLAQSAQVPQVPANDVANPLRLLRYQIL